MDDEFKGTTFIFFSEWLESIEKLPIDQQDIIISEWVRHGCRKPLVHEEDAPLLSSFASQRFGAIDASIKKYEEKVAQGKKGGRKSAFDKVKAKEMKQSNMYTNQEIADTFGVSKSTIDHL